MSDYEFFDTLAEMCRKKIEFYNREYCRLQWHIYDDRTGVKRRDRLLKDCDRVLIKKEIYQSLVRDLTKIRDRLW